MADGSRKVVYAALSGNLAIAITKFAAFGFTRSTAMLTEAIHSLVDTADQILLLIGQQRSEQRIDGAKQRVRDLLARADKALAIFGAKGDVLRAAARFVAERKN